MDYRDIITIESEKRSGKPCIRGMRITVSDVLEYLAGGMSFDEILADFPDLTVDDIRACLVFAFERDRRLFNIPANTTQCLTNHLRALLTSMLHGILYQSL